MGIRNTIPTIIKRANKVHNNKYDYTKIEYVNNKTKVKIVCPIHGTFLQRMDKHLSGESCPSCSPTKKITQEDFLSRCKEKHGDKYDYSKVIYTTIKEKVTIICRKHGEFNQKSCLHLSGSGCRVCGYETNRCGKKKTNEEIIEEFKRKHGNRYDYTETKYLSAREKVTIGCPEHGKFSQKASNHLRGDGCPLCKGGIGYGLDGFIKLAKIKHRNRYDYSKVSYKNTGTDIKIICKKHGEFNQRPSRHLRGGGCPSCSENKPFTTDSFIIKAKKIHGDKYDYSKVIYGKNNNCKVIIICLKHGEFKQVVNTHITGGGCIKCKESRGESKIRVFLDSSKIDYVKEKRFADCVDKRSLPFDFYLPTFNMCIEFNGQQHYKPFNRFGGQISLSDQLKRDKIKKQYCDDKGINLLIIKYNQNPSKILKKELNLFM
jgi:hypothetical protein